MGGPEAAASTARPGQVHRFLRRAGRRLRLARALQRTGRVAPVLATVCLVLAAVGRFTPLPATDVAALALAIAALAALLLAGLIDRPAPAVVARVADRGLGTNDVLATALELGERADILADRVRQGARAAVQTRRVARAVPLRPPYRRLSCAAALGTVALVAGIATNPQDARRRARAEVRAELEAAAVPLDALAAEADEPPAGQPGTPTDAAAARSATGGADAAAGADGADAADQGDAAIDAALARELRELAERVRRADDPGDAVRQLRRAQADLAAALSPEVVARRTAARGLDRAVEFLPLMGFGNPNEPETAVEQLDKAAARAANMRSDERAALADRLAELAQTQRLGNAPMADALEAAASALRNGDPDAARDALRAAAAAQTDALEAAAAAERRSEAAAALTGPTERLATADAARRSAASAASAASADADVRQGNGGPAASGAGAPPAGGASPADRGADSPGRLAGSPTGQGGGTVAGAKGGTGSGVSGAGQAADLADDGTVIVPEFGLSEDNGILHDQSIPSVTVPVAGAAAEGEGDGDVVDHRRSTAEDGTAVAPAADPTSSYEAEATTAMQRPDIPADVRALVRRYFAELSRTS